MGKYMRKAKTAGELAVMDLSLGVRTRARTLALQNSSSIPPSPSTASSAGASGSYLQLRSRRLQKPPIVVNDSAKRAKPAPAKENQNCASESQNQNPNSANANSSNSRARVRVSQADSGSGQNNGSNSNETQNEGIEVEETNKDLGVEASFGENALEIEGRERGTRESTPCSLIRQPESVRTPGSTTRPSTARPTGSMEGRGVRNSTQRQIPTTDEINQFFADAEEEQLRQFVEKYNFDPFNDIPLQGRFEWEKVNP